ncbi:MAG TPA: hypothetical protein VIV09_04930, partial [Pseudolabrys sp.]
MAAQFPASAPAGESVVLKNHNSINSFMAGTLLAALQHGASPGRPEASIHAFGGPPSSENALTGGKNTDPQGAASARRTPTPQPSPTPQPQPTATTPPTGSPVVVIDPVTRIE